MKAWKVNDKNKFYATVVFAETRGKAKSIARYTDCCQDTDFIDIEVSRMKIADKMYRNINEMDWEHTEDRIFLVKECGWHCEYIEIQDCKECVANEYCDNYQDYLELEKEENQ